MYDVFWPILLRDADEMLTIYVKKSTPSKMVYMTNLNDMRCHNTVRL